MNKRIKNKINKRAIKSVRKFQVSNNDILVFKINDRTYNARIYVSICDSIRKVFPNNKVVFLPHDVELVNILNKKDII